MECWISDWTSPKQGVVDVVREKWMCESGKDECVRVSVGPETTYWWGTLVATTAGSSAAGVELPTDDCRQPAGITDENSFFLFYYGESPFLGEFFFSLKNDTFYTKNGVFLHLLLHYLLRLRRLHPVRPCTGPVQ